MNNLSIYLVPITVKDAQTWEEFEQFIALDNNSVFVLPTPLISALSSPYEVLTSLPHLDTDHWWFSLTIARLQAHNIDPSLST